MRSSPCRGKVTDKYQKGVLTISTPPFMCVFVPPEINLYSVLSFSFSFSLNFSFSSLNIILVIKPESLTINELPDAFHYLGGARDIGKIEVAKDIISHPVYGRILTIT